MAIPELVMINWGKGMFVHTKKQQNLTILLRHSNSFRNLEKRTCPM